MATIYVSGFGEAASNGTYVDDGTYLGQARWTNGSRYIRSSGGGAPRWYIATTQTGVGTGAVYYDNNEITVDAAPYSPRVLWVDAGGGGTLGVVSATSESLLSQLIGYYKMDESSGDAADSSGAGLTLTNTNTVGFAAAAVNNGGDFGSTNTNKRFYRTSNFGVDTALSFACSVAAKVATEPASGEDQCLYRGGANASNVEWIFGYRNVAGTKKIYASRSKAGVAAQVVEYATTLGTSAFHQIGAAYDGVTLRVYLDGAEVASSAVSGSGSSTPSSATEIHVGGQNEDTDYGTNGHFKGILDCFGFWQRALTAAEMARLYNSGGFLQYPFAAAYSMAAAQGSYALTGQAVGFRAARKMAAAYGAYALTGFAALFSKGYGMLAAYGAYALTGNAVAFRAARRMAAAQGSYALTGQAVTLTLMRKVIIATGYYALTGFAVFFRGTFWRNIAKTATDWVNSDAKGSSTWGNISKS